MFGSTREALAFAWARRHHLYSAPRTERVQETVRDDAHDLASQVYAAIRAAGYDPHGELSQTVFDVVRRADRDTDEDGGSISTHPADLEAQRLARDSGPTEQVEALRALAAEEGAHSVSTYLREVGRVLLEHALVRPQSVPRSRRRVFLDETSGRIITTVAMGEADPAELEAEAQLLELAKLPMLGPATPARDLVGARQLYEPIARELAATGESSGYTRWAALDAAIGEWAGCSAQTARAQRLKVWGVRGKRGRPPAKGTGGQMP